MAHQAKPNRFRVALSFPGEYRTRVEKIVGALAARLGRDKVLYDKWYAAEFNRANLDIYLLKLYHDESDLVAVFLCKEYNAKEWCGLEWRACRDRLKHKEDDGLMFFRLDDADIPGLYSIDGYQDIRHMTDDEVAAAILSRLGETPRKKTYRAFTAKLPIVNPTLIGREKELTLFDSAWANLDTNFVQVIAAGGTGKTALVDKWFRRHLSEATVFGWSFYIQGTSADRHTSSDPFFAEILDWLEIEIASNGSVCCPSARLGVWRTATPVVRRSPANIRPKTQQGRDDESQTPSYPYVTDVHYSDSDPTIICRFRAYALDYRRRTTVPTQAGGIHFDRRAAIP
jgi:hypothetical protein